MSLWKFGSFETEVDFTDADFLDRLEEAEKELDRRLARVPKVGKIGDIVRSQCECFYAYFDTLFWPGAGNEIFEGKNSIALCIKAAESMTDCMNMQYKENEGVNEKYHVQNHGNRQQRRSYEKNHKKNNRNNNYPRKYN